MSATKAIAGYPAVVNISLLLARLTLGIIFMAHGSQKLFGLFGGPGLKMWVETMGPVGYLVAIGEFFGGLGLLTGFLSRFSAFWVIVIMIGAIVKVHAKNGFFLDPVHPGFEYVMALIGLLSVVLVSGAGRYAFARIFPPKAQRLLE